MRRVNPRLTRIGEHAAKCRPRGAGITFALLRLAGNLAGLSTA
jgi:hypothetical protein